MNPSAMPLPAACPGVLNDRNADDVVVWRRSGPLRAGELLERAARAAAALPAHRYDVNACEGRATFLIGFVAALYRGAALLLPAHRAPDSLVDLARRFPDQGVLTDESVEHASASGGAAAHGGKPGAIDAAQLAAIVFTSGSTGVPQGHAKRWSSLLATAELARERLLAGVGPCNLVATVPSQHMYGLETAIMLTLGASCAVADERPFFPRDIAEALALLPAPRALVTTPAHLRACLAARPPFPSLAFILSATAPLPAAVAAEAESQWSTQVHEIYGCTEAGSMATRRTVQSELWQPFRGSRVENRDGCATYVAAHLPQAVALQDVIEPQAGDTFRLVGRSGDLVKIAGKRASLADLTQQLLGIEGVADAVVFVPVEGGRCAALVVAPGLPRAAILAELAQRVDAAFLPRPLRLVDRLPRNEAGKLPREQLLALLGADAS